MRGDRPNLLFDDTLHTAIGQARSRARAHPGTT
jgi:hypothetical protein